MEELKKRNWLKAIITVSIAFLGAIIVSAIIYINLPSVFNIFTRDISPIDDSDLQLEKFDVPEKDNAYFDLLKIKDDIYFPNEKKEAIESMVAYQSWDNELAEELINKNELALKDFEDGLSKSRYEDPIGMDPSKFSMSMNIEAMGALQDMAKLERIRAQYLVRNGKKEEAVLSLLKISDMAQKIQDSRSSFVHYVVGLAMRKIALDGIQEIISTEKFNNKDLGQYIRKLDNYYLRTDGLDKYIKGEYITYVNMINYMPFDNLDLAIPESEKRVGYYFRPNKTKLLLAEDARMQISNLNLACEEENKKVVIDRCGFMHDSILETAILGRLEENIAGKAISCMTSNIGYSPSLVNNNNSRVRAVTLLIAVKEYYNDNEKYPDTIDTLSSYLSASLNFSKENLTYLKDQEIIKYITCNNKNDMMAKEESIIEIK